MRVERIVAEAVLKAAHDARLSEGQVVAVLDATMETWRQDWPSWDSEKFTRYFVVRWLRRYGVQ